MTTGQRRWARFPLTTPVNRSNGPSIDPRPTESAVKTAKLTGKGVAIGRNRAQDKGLSR